MRFSIIVPVYNAEKFVGDTICNLLRQNVDKEIILINDGSTDGSLSLIRDFESSNDCVKVIDKNNGGVSSARNLGLDIATGDYVIFVDSDDFIEVNLLFRCQQLLEDQIIDTIVFTYKYCFPDWRPDISLYYKPSGYYNLKEWLDDYQTLANLHIVHCIGTKIYCKSIIDKYHIRFNEELSCLEDVSFCARYLGYVQNLYYINEPLYHYRIVNQSSLISSYKKNLTTAIEFSYHEQMFLVERAYGKDIPHAAIYKVFAGEIVACIHNLLSRRGVQIQTIKGELYRLMNLPFLDSCIFYASDKSTQNKLKTLKLGDVSDIVIRLRFILWCEHIKEQYILMPMRKVFYFLKYGHF